MTTHTFEIPAEPQSVLVELKGETLTVHVDGDRVASIGLPEHLYLLAETASQGSEMLEALADVVICAHAIGKRDGRFQAEAEFHRAQRKAFPILHQIASHLEAVACAAERR